MRVRSRDIIHPFAENVKRKGEIAVLKPNKKPPNYGWFFAYNYLYFLLRAASDFFLRLTLGFS